MQLTSTKNPFLQSVRHAIASGRPTDKGRLVIEGPHLVAEVMRSAWRLHQIIITSEGLQQYSQLLSRTDAEIIEIPTRAFASISGTESSQQIMALVTPPVRAWQDCLAGPGPTVILDGIQDPGNAGTIVRSAEAFGASGLIFLDGCVHVANGKFLRASAGSIFRMPYLESEQRSSLLAQLRGANRKLYALVASGGPPLTRTDLRPPAAFIVGSEAHGVSPELLAAAEGLCIPTLNVESLNAGVACSLALFEAARQRGEL